MTGPTQPPALFVTEAQDRPGVLVHFEGMASPTCRVLPALRRQDDVRIGVFVNNRLLTHHTLAPAIWEDMLAGGWLEHPHSLVLHVAQEGPTSLVAQWYLVGAVRTTPPEGTPSGWLPRMLIFPQIHKRLNDRDVVYGAAAMRSAAAALALELAFGLEHGMTIGDQSIGPDTGAESVP